MCFFLASREKVPGSACVFSAFLHSFTQSFKISLRRLPWMLSFRWQVGPLSCGIPFCMACYCGYCCNPPVELTFSPMTCLSFRWCRDWAHRYLWFCTVHFLCSGLSSMFPFAKLTCSIFILYFTKERVRLWNPEEKSPYREVNSLLSWHSRHFKVPVVGRLKEL